MRPTIFAILSFGRVLFHSLPRLILLFCHLVGFRICSHPHQLFFFPVWSGQFLTCTPTNLSHLAFSRVFPLSSPRLIPLSRHLVGLFINFAPDQFFIYTIQSGHLAKSSPTKYSFSPFNRVSSLLTSAYRISSGSFDISPPESLLSIPTTSSEKNFSSDCLISSTDHHFPAVMRFVSLSLQPS